MRVFPIVASLAVTMPLVLAVAPAAAIAADTKRSCDVEITGKDEIVRSGDVVVSAGEHPRHVVALSGSVRVKRGATVDEAVALGGDVVIESDAAVTGDVTAVGGNVRLEKGARVEGNATTVGGKLLVAQGAALQGERHSVEAMIDGESLAQRVVGAVSAALRDADCHVRIRKE
ncbi:MULTISPECIES: polymer-forming cytoskeletal protein [Anaeromyxobacter]|uniref:polymer-forming cytoskeletal protein n=1 Tax=Anaeromyxobacter TaxID=161492 RepID=UPI001F58D802|nr:MULTISPECIES: polymer-forming cytoskeletal protein [unclassified Anaeromyxobacter]